jgi:hypothetical protein
MADSETPQSFARSCTDQRKKARAARICAPEMAGFAACM